MDKKKKVILGSQFIAQHLLQFVKWQIVSCGEVDSHEPITFFSSLIIYHMINYDKRCAIISNIPVRTSFIGGNLVTYCSKHFFIFY